MTYYLLRSIVNVVLNEFLSDCCNANQQTCGELCKSVIRNLFYKKIAPELFRVRLFVYGDFGIGILFMRLDLLRFLQEVFCNPELLVLRPGRRICYRAIPFSFRDMFEQPQHFLLTMPFLLF